MLIHCSLGFPFGNSPGMYNHYIYFKVVEIEARSWNNLFKVPPLVRCGIRIWQSGLGSELTACHALCHAVLVLHPEAIRGKVSSGDWHWMLTGMRSHGTRRKQHLGVQLTFILLCIILVCQLQLREESVILASWYRGITTSIRKTGGALPMYFESLPNHSEGNDESFIGQVFWNGIAKLKLLSL